MAFNVKTFYTRASTALIFVALLLGCVWYSYLSFIIFFIVVGFIGLNEFFKLSENLNAKPHKITAYMFYFLLMVSVTWANNLLIEFFMLILIFPFVLLIIELFKKESALINTTFTLLGFMYVAIPCVLLTKIVQQGYEAGGYFPQKVLGMIFFVWINDTGAYFVGSFFGKHKLYEKISPNKTWEGTIGGIALCIALSFVVAMIFPQLAIIHWIVISIIVAVFGNLGDLVESMLKRMAGVKDSGTLMPGHGGVLDRFDSLFFSTPFVFCYLVLMGLL